jgi:peroxiredoxin
VTKMKSKAIQPPTFQGKDINGKEFSLEYKRGAIVWLIFYPTGSLPSTHRHLDVMAQKAASITKTPLHIVAVFRSCAREEAEYRDLQSSRVAVVEDPSGELYNSYKKILGEKRTFADSLKSFVRNVLKIRITKKLRPLHFLIAEDGLLESFYQGNSNSDHLPWRAVKAFAEERAAGFWPEEKHESSTRAHIDFLLRGVA